MSDESAKAKEASEETYIYALTEPGTGRVRYIGRTQNVTRRWMSHLIDRGQNRKCKWVESLRQAGRFPVMTVIGRCRSEDAPAVETAWIEACMGPDLLNDRPGRKGPRGRGSAQTLVRWAVAEYPVVEGRAAAAGASVAEYLRRLALS